MEGLVDSWKDRLTGKQTNRGTDRKIDRWTAKEIYEQTDRMADIQMDKWIDGKTDEKMYGLVNRQRRITQKNRQMDSQRKLSTDRHSGGYMGGLVDRWKDRSTGKQTNRGTDRKADR